MAFGWIKKMKDIIYIKDLRVKTERFKEELNLDLETYKSSYQLSSEKLEAAKGDAIIMHPGPVNYVEITEAVYDSENSVIRQQIANGVAIRMAVDELKNRLISRGLDLDEVIEKRLINAKEELKYAELYDHIVLNDEFDKALKQINSIIFGMNHYDNNEINANLLRDLLD